jgi:hypothetical protein
MSMALQQPLASRWEKKKAMPAVSGMLAGGTSVHLDVGSDVQRCACGTFRREAWEEEQHSKGRWFEVSLDVDV